MRGMVIHALGVARVQVGGVRVAQVSVAQVSVRHVHVAQVRVAKMRVANVRVREVAISKVAIPVMPAKEVPVAAMIEAGPPSRSPSPAATSPPKAETSCHTNSVLNSTTKPQKTWFNGVKPDHQTVMLPSLPRREHPHYSMAATRSRIPWRCPVRRRQGALCEHHRRAILHGLGDLDGAQRFGQGRSRARPSWRARTNASDSP